MCSTKNAKIVILTVSIFLSSRVYAKEFFDPGLLQAVNGNAAIADTSLLSEGYQPAGTYRVHIDVNGKSILYSSVRFEPDKDKQLVACLSFQSYQKLGVDMSKIDANAEDNEVKNACISMEEQLPGTKVDFDFSKMKLDVSIPQTVLRDENIQGVPEEEWDEGIPALISAYQLSGQHYLSHEDGLADSLYANLTNGVNIGRWRYRNNSTVSKDEGVENISNYIETAIHSLKGELTVGDASTSGDIFDGLLLRGAQLASDEDMIPDQLTGFAPLIRGIAKSNARITIRENNNIIYQRNVPPGPFVISDLSSVSNGGRLDVTVTEADGSETHSTVAYSSVPQLLRKGQIKYSLAAGKYISGSEDAIEKEPNIIQSTLTYGLPMNVTSYGGMQLHNKFKAFSAGLGVDLQQLGGMAFDDTRSISQRGRLSQLTGDMVRLTYRNNIASTDTQIQMDSRYYLHSYVSFQDWADTSDLMDDSRKRREYNFSVNQDINDSQSFYASLSRTENADSTVSRSWQFGWNNSFESWSLSLAYSMTRDKGQSEWDKQLAMTISVPFSKAFPNAQPNVNYSATTGLKGDLSNRVGVTGKVAGRDDINWNTQFSYETQRGEPTTKSSSLGVDYQGNYTEFNGTYNAGQDKNISWNASGNLIAHRHGITAGRFSSGSQALLAVPGVPGVALDDGQKTITDSRGYATIPDLRSYHRNALHIDPQSNKKVDFTNIATEVVPTKDAVVLAQFNALSGNKIVMTVKHNGTVLPFGARARIEGQDDTYYVGDRGQIYINAAPEKGKVHFSWGGKSQCDTSYEIAANSNALPLTLISANCQ